MLAEGVQGGHPRDGAGGRHAGVETTARITRPWIAVNPRGYNTGSSSRGRPIMDTRRMILDCRKFPSEKKCSLAISGDEADVLEAAVQHAAARHGHTDSPELRSQLRSMMQEERSTTKS